MKKIKMLRGCVATAAIFSFLFLAACGDDSSSGAPNDDESSSSSVIPGIDPESNSGSAQSSSSNGKTNSSSSVKGKSSSSVIPGIDPESSSGSSQSSSSNGMTNSSSSVKAESSSSVIPALDPESSSSQKVESSSSKDPEPVEGSCSSSEYKRESCNVEKDENCIKDDRDGQTYKTVTIGTQMWMAENLNYETANSFCYGDDASNCAKSGRLYTWAAAIDSVALYDGGNGVDCGYGKSCTLPDKVQGICPEGWHLPTNAEWNTLFTAVGGKSVAGTKLKSTSSWNSSGNGADAFSFSALPAGHRYDNATYSGEGYYAYFWSSSEVNSDVAYYMFLYYEYDDAYLSRKNKGYGYSVRCLKD